MQRIPLKAEERQVLGKKVKRLRADGFLPGHVYGKKQETEHVSVGLKDFLKVFDEAGETGLVDLRIGEEKVRPVLIRGIQFDPVKGVPLHIDFYQVNLKEKVAVPVPIKLVGDEPELVHTGEAIVLQTLNEIQVEGLPMDLIDEIEVNIGPLKQIDDAITVSQLSYNHDTLTVLADADEVVVKLAPAVSEEMKALLEEQEAEAAAAVAEETAEEGGETKAEGEEEGAEETEVSAEGGESQKEDSDKASEE